MGIQATRRNARLIPTVHWTHAGMNLILHAADMTRFREDLDRDLNTLREGAGDEANPNAER